MLHGISPPVFSDLAVLPPTVLISPSTKDFATRMVALHNQVKRRLAIVYVGYKSQRDVHRCCVVFEPGDLVMVFIKEEQSINYR